MHYVLSLSIVLSWVLLTSKLSRFCFLCHYLTKLISITFIWNKFQPSMFPLLLCRKCFFYFLSSKYKLISLFEKYIYSDIVLRTCICITYPNSEIIIVSILTYVALFSILLQLFSARGTEPCEDFRFFSIWFRKNKIESDRIWLKKIESEIKQNFSPQSHFLKIDQFVSWLALFLLVSLL